MANFLKQVVASAIGSVLGLVIFAAGSAGLGLALLIALSTSIGNQRATTATLEPKTMLAIDLSDPIQEAPPTDRQALAALVADKQPKILTLRAAIEAIERGAQDPNIVGIYLSGDSPSVGPAAASELRRALGRFRQTGKRILAYGLAWDERSYYLISVADRLVLNPFGLIEANGFASVSPFVATALAKYGVGVQVIRAGKYKSAVETFANSSRSPENREQIQALLASQWSQFKTAAIASRKLTPEAIEAVATNQGVLRADEAKQAGWIDDVAYEDATVAEARKLGAAADPEHHSFRQIDPLEYLQATGGDQADRSYFGRSASAESENATPQASPASPTATGSGLRTTPPSPSPSSSPSDSPSAKTTPSTKTKAPRPTAGNAAASGNNRIAIVYASGQIVSGRGDPDQIGSDRLAADLRRLRYDEAVKAIVLRIDSPGGSATASEVIQREFRLTRDRKPIIVSMGDVAASGGYWIAAYGTKIFAEPNTITGSIGVFGLLPNIQKFSTDQGITWDAVKTGPLADSSSISRPKTPQELALLQRSIDWTYEQFLERVAEARRLPIGRVNEIAQGRVWSGTEALRLGLVDQLGGLEDAVTAAATAAKLKDWTIEERVKHDSFDLSSLFSGALIRWSATSPPIARWLATWWLGDDRPGLLTAPLRRLETELSTLNASASDPQPIYARLPFVIDPK